MKQLEAIGLVQYFLYERKDLDIGWNTAFLGPNGTGKTALLDALQIVLLAADDNRMHFNASGEGKKKARSLRDYCLGIYGQTEEERCRPAANTYINLVFRDPETDKAVTVGVACAASIDSLDVSRSFYILPGVALTTASHIEREGSREIVMPWRRFQHVAGDLCRMAGTKAEFPGNGAEFTRRLFVEHLASPGEKPNVKAIRSAFARSLKLNQDVTSLDETLRQHLIEQRPTNVRQFRARLVQFREVRDLIHRIKERIDRATAVGDKYAVVQRERTNQANAECLSAVYESERLAEQIGANREEVEKLTATLEVERLALERASLESQQAEAAKERALTAQNLDPDYRKQAGHAERLRDLQSGAEEKDKELANAVGVMLAAVQQAGHVTGMEDHRGAFEAAANLLIQLQHGVTSHTMPDAMTILAASRSVSEVHTLLRKALTTAEAEARVAKDRRRDAKTSLERAQRGQTDLRPETTALQRMLHDAGIQATPVCDLVTITDATWQPAIEAYLSTNIEALLVPDDPKAELAAVDLYKDLKGPMRIYGVKLALPSRGRPWQQPGSGRFAAQLVTGDDKHAVRYLQGELGRLALAATSEQLRVGQRAISVEGMLSTGGGVERLRLPASDALKIGRGDAGARSERAERALREAEQALALADALVKSLSVVEQRLAPFGDPDATHRKLEGLFATTVEARRVADELAQALAATETDRLAELKSALVEAGHRLTEARRIETQHRDAITRAETLRETLNKTHETLERQLSLATANEAKGRQHALYNANVVEKYRERYDERFGDDWDARINACKEAVSKAGGTAANADRDAWQMFVNYLADYQLQNNDIANSEWMRAYQYILADRQRLQDLELAEQLVKAEEAYEAAVKVFRTDVAQALLEGFDAVREQIDSLNSVLRHAPEFSNGERYQFKHSVLPQHDALHAFLLRVREQGDSDEDMFGGSGKVPEEFRALVDADGDSELLQETSPLNDHRRFFSYDVEIYREGKSIGWLSKRLGPGSGGEHRTPLYVIFGAALAAAYGKAKGTEGTGGIMLLDEAFEKMDPQNVRATAEYLNAIGLQLIMAGPETDQPKMSSFLHIYYDMARFGSSHIQMTKNDVKQEARELLRSDNFALHPELLEAAVATLESERAGR